MALLGVGPLGNQPIGWQPPSAVFGINGIGLLYPVALSVVVGLVGRLVALLLALTGCTSSRAG